MAAGSAFGQQAREISVGVGSTSFATVGVRIAKEMGLFAKRGLDAKFTIMDSANVATQALISKSVNFVLSGPGELVAAQARGQNVVAISNAYMGLSGWLVLSKATADKLGVSPTAPVTERLKALNGLVIASTSPTGGFTVAFRGATEGVGATIRFTYMSQPAMPAALESGAIQGYISGAPFWAVPVVKGSGVLWLSGPKGELPAANVPATSGDMQAMRDFAEANPDLIKTVAAVFDDLAKAVDERPAEVKAAVARLYPDLDAPSPSISSLRRNPPP